MTTEPTTHSQPDAAAQPVPTPVTEVHTSSEISSLTTADTHLAASDSPIANTPLAGTGSVQDVAAPIAIAALPEPVGLAAVGQILRQTRLQKGLSTVEVSAHLKRAQRQIEALETGREADLPPLAFVKGFVRNYAKLLGLDGENLVSKLNPVVIEENVLAAGKVDMRELFPQHDLLKVSVARTGKSWTWLFLPLAILFLLLALLEWVPGLAQGLGLGKVFPVGEKIAALFSTENVRSAPPSKEELSVKPVEQAEKLQSPNTNTNTNAVNTPAAATTSATNPATSNATDNPNKDNAAVLNIKFSEVSWVDIKDNKGVVLLTGVQAKGTEQNLSSIAADRLPLSVSLGNAAGTQLSFRGKPVDVNAASKENVAKLSLP